MSVEIQRRKQKSVTETNLMYNFNNGPLINTGSSKLLNFPQALNYFQWKALIKRYLKMVSHANIK